MNHWINLSLFSLVLFSCGGTQRANVKPASMPSGGSFTGVWHSPQYGEMQLVQNGNTVIGEYEKDERSGKIQGHAVGDLMRFEWTDHRELVRGKPLITKGHGYFKYTMGDDGDHYIVGEWGHGNDEIGGGPWRAVKDRRRKPQLSTDRTTTGGESLGDDLDEGGSEGTPSNTGSEAQEPGADILDNI